MANKTVKIYEARIREAIERVKFQKSQIESKSAKVKYNFALSELMALLI